MKKVILLSLFQANGGIASWSKIYIRTFKSDEFTLIPVDRSTGLSVDERTDFIKRRINGLITLWKVVRAVKKTVLENNVAILHTTTSGGSLGTIRDYWVARVCRSKGIPCIMHCRYGCITEDLRSGLKGLFLQKTMSFYNQVWVLDNRSANAMRSYKRLKDIVYVTPNSIEVKDNIEIHPKSYRHVAFIANLEPTKGLFELVEAVKRLKRNDIVLSIVGKGTPDVMKRLEAEVSGYDNIRVLGQLPNDQAVNFMRKIDILALPTYMSQEAFPISILEAMSLGKLVISTQRAAIGDMLIGLDDKPCGIFVREKSIEDITNAILWCVNHSLEADEICRRAYDKVYNNYRTDVVYDLYKSHYKELI